jgi:hypothetical protein
LARKYFAWIGPATARDFQEFAGLGVKAAKAAMEPLELVDVGEEQWLLPEDEAAFRKFKAPAKPRYALVSSIDNITLLWRDAAAGSMRDSHPIIDRGRLVGRWEFDAPTESIAWVSFIPRDKALEDAVRKKEVFIRKDLGDARGFSLDSPARRAPRIAAIRQAAGA